MYGRRIAPDDVARVVDAGDVIEDYPDDTPLPSRLLLGQVDGRPLHVVAADDVADEETLVVTVYEPDPARWTPDFRRRRTR